jgi:hypothetical protein
MSCYARSRWTSSTRNGRRERLTVSPFAHLTKHVASIDSPECPDLPLKIDINTDTFLYSVSYREI